MHAATRKKEVAAVATATVTNDGDVVDKNKNKNEKKKVTVADFKEFRKKQEAKAEKIVDSLLRVLPRPDNGNPRTMMSTVTASNPFLMRVHELRRKFPFECNDDKKAIRLAKKVLLPEAKIKNWSIGSTLDPQPEQAGRKPQPVDLFECSWALRHNWPLNPDLSDAVCMTIEKILTTLAGINSITAISGIRVCEHPQKENKPCNRNECLKANGAIIVVPMLYARQPCGGCWMNLSRVEGVREHLYQVAKELKENYDKLNNIQEVRVYKDPTSAGNKEGKTILLPVEQDASKVFPLGGDDEDSKDDSVPPPPSVVVIDEKDGDDSSKSKVAAKRKKKKKTAVKAVAAEACSIENCPCHPLGNKETVFKWLSEAENGKVMNARMDHIMDQTKVAPDWWDELKQEGGVLDQFCQRLGPEKMKTDLAATMLNDLVVLEKQKQEKKKNPLPSSATTDNPFAGKHIHQDSKDRRSDAPLSLQHEDSELSRLNTWRRTPKTVIGGTSSLARELAQAVRVGRQGTITLTNDTGHTIQPGTILAHVNNSSGQPELQLFEPPQDQHQLDRDSSSNPMGQLRTPQAADG
jgi:hypothetical protein